jgi:hypothetical protein
MASNGASLYITNKQIEENQAMAQVGRKHRKPLTDAEIRADFATRPTVPVWPHLGWFYNVGREKSYEIAGDGLKQGLPEFLRVDNSIRVVTAVLRKKHPMEASACATEAASRTMKSAPTGGEN